MLIRKFSLVFALTLATAICSQQVSAHAHLKSQYLAANANVDTAPQTLTLIFSEDIEPAFSGVEIIDANQKVIPLLKSQHGPEQHNKMTVPLEKTLGNGHYQVNWHVLSVDGHQTHGNYTFSVK